MSSEQMPASRMERRAGSGLGQHEQITAATMDGRFAWGPRNTSRYGRPMTDATPTLNERPRRQSVDRRAHLRDEAARIFAERGYHAASLQEVADAIGFTKASIYYYYK